MSRDVLPVCWPDAADKSRTLDGREGGGTEQMAPDKDETEQPQRDSNPCLDLERRMTGMKPNCPNIETAATERSDVTTDDPH
jgi:hypothetical protein